MPETTTQRVTPILPTERLARAALALHRLALTASEVQHLPSPVAKRETTKRGAVDMTATTALDERRAAVVEALSDVDTLAHILTDKDLTDMAQRLVTALNQWDGRR